MQVVEKVTQITIILFQKWCAAEGVDIKTSLQEYYKLEAKTTQEKRRPKTYQQLSVLKESRLLR